MDAPAAAIARDRAALDAALAVLDGQSVVVGYSGGLDSTVLLHALAARRARLAGLRAIHVDHALHPDSARWSARCESACATLGIPLQVARVAVVAAGDGPESAARRARYAAFAAALGSDDVLVLAHHRDDQAETVLLRLLRGAGSDGLAAMRPARALGEARVVRPLLDIARAQLEAIARADGLAWNDDPSNADTRLDRNHVRHVILPALAARWPQAAAALAGSARLLAEDAALLAAETAHRLAAVRRSDGALSVAGVTALDPAWRARVVRAWVAAAGMAPPPAGMHARLAAEVLAARSDGTPTLRWPDGGLRRWRDGLYPAAPSAASASGIGWELPWDGGAWLHLPDGSRLGFTPDAGASPNAPPPSPDMRVRTRRGGERLRLPGRTHHHQLKHLLQDAGVPPWQRARLPLVFAGDGELLAAGESLVGARLAAWSAQHGRHLRWHGRAD